MSTASERVINRALSGAEVKKLMRIDFERALAEHSLLVDYAAFGRIGWTIEIGVETANPMLKPEDRVVSMASKAVAVNLVSKDADLASVESVPLAVPTEDAEAEAVTVHRAVNSPNAERLRHGLPVPVDVKQQDGTTITESMHYPPQPELGPGDVTVEKTTASWKDRLRGKK